MGYVWTYQDISAELVGFILEGGILLSDDSPDVSCSLSDTLQISFHSHRSTAQTHINKSSWKVLALLGELLQLLEKSMRDIRRGLYDGRSPCSKCGVDFGSPVNDILDHRRGMLKPRGDSLSVS